MEGIPISLVATLGGFAVAGGMGIKLVRDLGEAWFVKRGGRADYLELFVNGKDYSVDLKTISNGGSERIHKALKEVERCS